MQNKSVDISPLQNQSSLHHPLHPEQQPLQQMTALALKAALSQILSDRTLEERYVMTKIYAPELLQALQTALPRLNPHALQHPAKQGQFSSSKHHYSQKQDFKLSESEEEPAATKSNPCNFITFVSDQQHFLSHLVFDYSLLQNPNKLFDLLTPDLPDQNRWLMAQALSSPRNLQTTIALITRCKTQEQLNQELLSFLRESLMKQLYCSLFMKQRHQLRLEEQKKLKNHYNQFWNYQQKQDKLKLLLLNCKDIEGLAHHLSNQRIFPIFDLLSQEITALLTLDKNNFFKDAFKCSLKDIFSPIKQYRQILFHSLKKEIELSKRKKPNRQLSQQRDYNSEDKVKQKEQRHPKRKKQKIRKSMSMESNETNYTEHERQFLERSTHPPDKPKEEEQPTIKTDHHRFQEHSQKDKRERDQIHSSEKEEKSIKSSKVYNRCPKRQIKYKEYHPTIDNEQKKIENRPSAKQDAIIVNNDREGDITKHTTQGNNKYSPQTLKQASLTKLAHELQEMSNNISEEANLYYQRRIVAFERVQFLLQYYQIPIKLFGSCANGIAVKNSDIDIAVDQSILYWVEFIPENLKISVALERLSELFQAYPCFKEIKVIKTAAIPVLKMIIDTSVPFLGIEYVSLNRPHYTGPIQADLTIQTINKDNQSSHLGVRTTKAIQQWLSDIKPLHKIVIIMKQFFAVNKLNLAYEGGLNTISMIVMLVAYITHMGLQNQENEAMVLQKILYFYSEEFDQTETGIDLLKINGDKIFYKKGSYNKFDSPRAMKAQLEIRDPICQSKNMTRNCYLYPQIKKMFKTMLDSCFNRSLIELEDALLSHLQQHSQQSLPSFTDRFFSSRNVFLDLHKLMEPSF